jgi:hypothetical protein
MSNIELELNPVDFITVGILELNEKRLFCLQAGHSSRNVSLSLDEVQTRALAKSVAELLDDLIKGHEGQLSSDLVDLSTFNMALREPIGHRAAFLKWDWDMTKTMVWWYWSLRKWSSAKKGMPQT